LGWFGLPTINKYRLKLFGDNAFQSAVGDGISGIFHSFIFFRLFLLSAIPATNISKKDQMFGS